MAIEDDEISKTRSTAVQQAPLVAFTIVFVILVAIGIILLIRGGHARGWHDLRALRLTADEGYLYFLIETGGEGAPVDWSKEQFRIAIDTYDPNRGERRLPAPGEADVATGVEFMIEIAGPGKSRISVTPAYNPYQYDVPIASPSDPAGRFVPLIFEANRLRFGRDGTRYPAQTLERGLLRFGSLDPASAEFDTRADIAIGSRNGTLEMRIPWSLLNVSDPSSRLVIHTKEGEGQVSAVPTEGFHVYLYSIDPRRPGEAPIDQLPRRGQVPPIFAWTRWDVPQYRLEMKLGAAEIRDTMKKIPDNISNDPTEEAAR